MQQQATNAPDGHVTPEAVSTTNTARYGSDAVANTQLVIGLLEQVTANRQAIQNQLQQVDRQMASADDYTRGVMEKNLNILRLRLRTYAAALREASGHALVVGDLGRRGDGEAEVLLDQLANPVGAAFRWAKPHLAECGAD